MICCLEQTKGKRHVSYHRHRSDWHIHPSSAGQRKRERDLTVNSTVRWDIRHQGADTQSKVINFCRLPWWTDCAESQSSGWMNKRACHLQIRRLGSDFTYSCLAIGLYSYRGWIHPPLYGQRVYGGGCVCVQDKQRQRLLHEHVADEHKSASDNVAGCGFAACCYN